MLTRGIAYRQAISPTRGHLRAISGKMTPTDGRMFTITALVGFGRMQTAVTCTSMSGFTSSDLADGTQDHLNECIIAADCKASILITGQFAFLGLTATALSNLSQVPTGWFRWFVIAMSVFGVLAVLLAVVAIYPRTPSPSEGYIYWRISLSTTLMTIFARRLPRLMMAKR